MYLNTCGFFYINILSSLIEKNFINRLKGKNFYQLALNGFLELPKYYDGHH
jgi:hypothetical protein